MSATAQTLTVIGLLLAVLAGIKVRHHHKKRQRRGLRMTGPRGFILTPLAGLAAGAFMFTGNGGHALNGRQIGMAAVATAVAALLYAMWLTPGGWQRPKQSPGLPVDGAPLSDRDRLILAHMEGHMNGTNCLCGCPRKVHEHYRFGSDCSVCDCRVYRRPGWLRRFLDRRGDSWGVRRVQKAGREAWAAHQDREAS